MRFVRIISQLLVINFINELKISLKQIFERNRDDIEVIHLRFHNFKMIRIKTPLKLVATEFYEYLRFAIEKKKFNP